MNSIWQRPSNSFGRTGCTKASACCRECGTCFWVRVGGIVFCMAECYECAQCEDMYNSSWHQIRIRFDSSPEFHCLYLFCCWDGHHCVGMENHDPVVLWVPVWFVDAVITGLAWRSQHHAASTVFVPVSPAWWIGVLFGHISIKAIAVPLADSMQGESKTTLSHVRPPIMSQFIPDLLGDMALPHGSLRPGGAWRWS